MDCMTDSNRPDRESGSGAPKGAPGSNTADRWTRRSFLSGIGLLTGAAGLIPGVARAREEDAAKPAGLRIMGRGAAPLSLRVNGGTTEVTVEPRTTLLTALREHAGLTGPKEVCDRGACGCCTVLVDGVAVNSCLMLAVDAAGKEITTVEGIAADPAHANYMDHLCEHDGAQCGFCIPGFVTRGAALLKEEPTLDTASIREGLAGNICRCGTYNKLFEGMLTAAGVAVAVPYANKGAVENELPRVDVRLKLSGAAKYTADQYPQGMIFAAYVRFPYGSGRLISAKVETARAVPGVLEVEVRANAEGRYPGDRIGHVVAESRDALRDALAALKMEFRRGSPRTIADEFWQGPPEPDAAKQAELDALFASAAAVVESTYRTQVQTHSSFETHGGVVDYKGDRAEAWGSTQGVIAYRDGLTTPLGLDASQVRVHSEYVGGGFGSKFDPGAEGNLAARMSKKYNRPCRSMLTRAEEHLDSGNRPGSIQYMKIAADKQGKLLGGRIHVASVVGFEPGGGGAQNPMCYEFGNIHKTESEIQLDSGLPRAFRAPGWPQGCFAVQSMIDELSEKLGLDPLAVRQLNETSGRRRRQMEIGAQLIGWSRRKPTGSQTGRIRRGLGVGSGHWIFWPTKCEAEVRIHRSGRVEALSGVQDIGTGTFTVVTDVCADELGISRDLVTGRVGLSDYPPGPGSGGSQTARSVVPAVRDAAAKVRVKLLELVAQEWKLEPSALSVSEGKVRETGGTRTAEWADACSLIVGDRLEARGSVTKNNIGEGDTDAVQFAEVEVDTETGVVRVPKIVAIQACGRVVNKLLAENQIYGGVIQGVSYALFEDRILDRVTGAMVNPNLEWYKIAGPVDVPEIIPVLDADGSETGVRSIGEPVTIPTAAAIANGVANAIGVRVRELPITPERVLAALQANQGGRS